MTALFEAIQLVEYAAFGLLGILAFAHWRRRPSPASGWLAATLGTLASVVAVSVFFPDDIALSPAQMWTGKVVLAVLAMFPYFLFRFMATFVNQPRWLERTAAGLTGTVAAASLLLPRFPDPQEPIPPLFAGYMALLLIDWIALSAVVAVRLWQGGKGQPGVARRRMRTLSLGTIGLALALFVAGVAPTGQEATPAAFAVLILGLTTAPLFLLGFAPPRLFRLAWRREEERALRVAELELMKTLDPERIADILLPSMCALVGGDAAVLHNAEGAVVGSHRASRAGAGTEPGEESAFTVQLGSGDIVVYASRFTPFFGTEEAQILQSLGVLADLALTRADLFQAEQRKNSYLRILQQVTASANAVEGPHQAIQSALDMVCAETWWVAGRAYTTSPDGGGLEQSRNWRLEAFSRQSEEVMNPDGSGAWGGDNVAGVLSTGRSIWVTDLALELPGETSIHGASALVPIRVGSHVVGALEFLAAGPQELDLELLDVLTQIGVQLGRAVERAESQEELRKRAEDLSRSNADLEQFAYVASHDLQEPLRMVSSYMQLLSERYEDSLDETGQRYIHYAVDGATRMQSLVRDLLSFSRVGSRGCEMSPVDLNQVLEQTLVNFELAVKECGAVVTADDLPPVMGDQAQLTQLLQNLVGNAIKFHGTTQPEVHISAVRQGREWLVRVTDNGVGFDAKYAERVFVIFKRLHSREDYPGTGIGLAISKKIVERHGGKIWAESEPGRGTTISFTLPTAQEVTRL